MSDGIMIEDSDLDDPIEARASELAEFGVEAYHDRLRLTVRSAEEAFDDVLAATEGERTDAVRSFANPAALRELLTERRIEVMESVMGESPASISALADRLGRNYREVHDDVQLLAEHGIVYLLDGEGRAKQPVIPYEEIVIEATLARAPAETEDHVEA